MAWPTDVVRSWDEFLYASARITDAPPTTVSYLLRGQADAEWPLKPSLLRHLSQGIESADALRLETRAWKEFVSQAHLHVPSKELRSDRSYIQWLALMQHHHAPPRLLDWTASPFVAAYFAVDQLWDRDGAIWVFHAATLWKHTKAQLGEEFNRNESKISKYIETLDAVSAVYSWEPSFKSDRMVAQQGYLTFCFNILGDQEAIIESACSEYHRTGGKGISFQKLIIPRDLKPRLLRNLRSLNVGAPNGAPADSV